MSDSEKQPEEKEEPPKNIIGKFEGTIRSRTWGKREIFQMSAKLGHRVVGRLLTCAFPLHFDILIYAIHMA